MAAKPKKKPFPFHDGTVNENAPIRVVRYVKPECPVDPTPELRQRDGSFKPNPRYTGEENCQIKYRVNMQGVWDVAKCESIGHDPWHTVFRRRLTNDIVNPESGEVTEGKPRILEEERINIIAVSVSERHTSGTEAQLAKARGCLTLDEYGARFPDEWYESPCEFRSCTKPVQLETRLYGNFCSERHARLCASEQRGIMRLLKNDRDPDAVFQKGKVQEYEERVEAINLGVKEK